MNKNIVSGKVLSEKFEVSERTIQRDIESINLAGIPIVSHRGANGGYEILKSYKSSHNSIENSGISDIKKTIESLENNHSSNNYGFDLNIATESETLTFNLTQIDYSIENKKCLSFNYTNASGNSSFKDVEPIFFKFKWYTWYLLAYDMKKNRYGIYKISRINNLSVINQEQLNAHPNANELFDQIISDDNRKYLNIQIRCKHEFESRFLEYFPKARKKHVDSEYIAFFIELPENEHIWFAHFLGFGNNIEIINPDILRNRILEHIKSIAEIYKD
jgi:predicted DNA-binding transcriptional regulator YafY